MRLEDMKNQFPEMPKDMRAMVEREVEKKMKTVDGKFPIKKTFVVALIATMAIGTTVFAGVKLYQMNSDPVGDYAVDTNITNTGDSGDAGTASGTFTIPAVVMETNYLPEGMIEMEEGKYSYEDAPYEGGVSVLFYRMDTGDDAFSVRDTNVLFSEELKVGGHDGVYLEFQKLNDGSISFNQRLYVSYSDVHYVMQMFIGENVSREEALKIAEGIRLVPAENLESGETVNASNWSDYLKSVEEDEMLNASGEIDFRMSATMEDLKNTHFIGDTFSASGTQLSEAAGLEIKVADVKISDDIALLDRAYLDEEITNNTDTNGNLLPNTVHYVKSGDGINTVDEVIETREVSQKLVYATVEYINNSDNEMTDVIFYGSIIKLAEDADGYSIYEGEKPEEGDIWDTVVNTSSGDGRMLYFDVRGGERNNNYISSIKPGETVTVHMAFIVNEDEMNYLFLNLDTQSGSYEFSETALKMGYVDIRQGN